MEEVFASETSYSVCICSLCSERGDVRFCMYETFCHVPAETFCHVHANSGLFEMPDSKGNNNQKKKKIFANGEFTSSQKHKHVWNSRN